MGTVPSCCRACASSRSRVRTRRLRFGGTGQFVKYLRRLRLRKRIKIVGAGMSTKFLWRGIPVKDSILLSTSDRKVENNYCGIIPVLPDDVALQCLARVPRMYHPMLRCVSKSWCQSIDSWEFLEQRRLLGCSEDWLYLHVGTSPHLDERNVGKRNRWQLVGGYSQWHALDPERYKWFTLPPIPYDQAVTGGQVVLGATSAVLNGKLYVIGGAPFGKAAIRYFLRMSMAFLKSMAVQLYQMDVWTYDPRRNKWRKGASMSTARFAGLVGVMEDKLYVVGGSGMCHLTGYSIPSLEIYDPITNKWQHAASAQGAVAEHPFNPLKHSAVLEGYFCVTGPQNVNGSMNGGMYDPLTDKWSEMKPGLHGGWGKPSTVMDGKLYIVDFGCYKQYVPEDDCWVPMKCETEDLLLGWDPRLILAMSSSIEKLYVVGTMGSALIVMVVPVKNSKICQSITWHMMKIPSGIDFLGDMGYCSCQILAY